MTTNQQRPSSPTDSTMATYGSSSDTDPAELAPIRPTAASLPPDNTTYQGPSYAFSGIGAVHQPCPFPMQPYVEAWSKFEQAEAAMNKLLQARDTIRKYQERFEQEDRDNALHRATRTEAAITVGSQYGGESKTHTTQSANVVAAGQQEDPNKQNPSGQEAKKCLGNRTTAEHTDGHESKKSKRTDEHMP